MEAKKYEDFIKEAFGLKINNGNPIEYAKDPAELANTSIFNENNLPLVKSATIYAMHIFSTELCEDYNDIYKEIIDAKNLSQISQLIEEFRNQDSVKVLIGK